MLTTETKQQFIERSTNLANAIRELSNLYDIDELNDEVDISKLIPYSLDEWYIEWKAVIDEYSTKWGIK